MLGSGGQVVDGRSPSWPAPAQITLIHLVRHVGDDAEVGGDQERTAMSSWVPQVVDPTAGAVAWIVTSNAGPTVCPRGATWRMQATAIAIDDPLGHAPPDSPRGQLLEPARRGYPGRSTSPSNNGLLCGGCASRRLKPLDAVGAPGSIWCGIVATPGSRQVLTGPGRLLRLLVCGDARGIRPMVWRFGRSSPSRETLRDAWSPLHRAEERGWTRRRHCSARSRYPPTTQRGSCLGTP